MRCRKPLSSEPVALSPSGERFVHVVELQSPAMRSWTGDAVCARLARPRRQGVMGQHSKVGMAGEKGEWIWPCKS